MFPGFGVNEASDEQSQGEEVVHLSQQHQHHADGRDEADTQRVEPGSIRRLLPRWTSSNTSLGRISQPTMRLIKRAPSGMAMPSDIISMKSSQLSFQGAYFTVPGGNHSLRGVLEGHFAAICQLDLRGAFLEGHGHAVAAQTVHGHQRGLRHDGQAHDEHHPLRTPFFPWSAPRSRKKVTTTSIKEMAEEMAAMSTRR